MPMFDFDGLIFPDIDQDKSKYNSGGTMFHLILRQSSLMMRLLQELPSLFLVAGQNKTKFHNKKPPKCKTPPRHCCHTNMVVIWTLFLCASMVAKASAISYTAPDDCEWIAINSNEVSVSCRLQTIISSGVLATNFTLIQTDHTTMVSILCDPVFFESTLAQTSFSHLRFLKSLTITQCKLRDLPNDGFRGLIDLRNLTIRTFNSEWGAYPLELYTDSLSSLRLLESLNLGYNKITRITPEMICDLSSLKVLNLTHNDLHKIIDMDHKRNEFGECINDLVELDVSNNKIATINPHDLRHFKKLRVLVLRNNRITHIVPSSFQSFGKLQILDISGNHLERLHPLLLQDSPDIRELYIQNNSLSSLPQGFLTGLQQLLILNLSYNEITSESIGADTFIDLIRLVILELSHNRLQYVNSSLFISQYSLQMLLLSHNDISIIADNTFSSLYNLHTLDLSHNNLKYLDAFTLNGLYVISSLMLSNNHIYSIHPDAFKNCSSVQNLDLQGNNLSFIPIALQSLQFVKSLGIANNSITELANVSFRELRQLSSLDLSLNLIQNLTKVSFSQMPTLQSIILSRNKIHSLEHGVFDEAESLENIDLSYNTLTDINGLFMNIKRLKHLNVSNNKITWFDYALIPTDLDLLDLHGNEIDVLGNYYELEAILKLSTLDASFNRIKEVNGNSFPNRILYLNLAHNRISTIHQFTFLSKTNLTIVSIAHNNLQTLDINTFRMNPLVLKEPLPEFYIAGNPYFCDCDMEWMQHMNRIDGTSQYPHIADMDDVDCKLAFTRHHRTLPLVKSKSSDFLCKYRSHCFALCHCCEFDACDCEMVCPENCTCYSDQTWNTNIVDCAEREFSSMPSVIPMDVTDLYLDGNNIFQLTSHTFIGRKNMRVIYLNNSNIHLINNRTFNGLLTLRVLHLENNRLAILHGYEFETLVHLKELYLSNNNISFIANTTFQNLKSLQVLHLDHNLIMEFQVWNLNWNTLLIEVHLGYNPYTCNCQYLESYRDWLHSVSTIVRDTNSIKCKQNKSSGTYLLDFNHSLCSNFSEITYFQAVFQTDYMPVTVIVVSVAVVLVVFFVLAVVYRHDIKVWMYSKFGLRLFERNQFPAEHEKLFDAFVSYSKKDESFVSQFLAPELECGAPSHRLCLRYRDLPMSGYVAEAITEAIECSHRTIVVLSEQFLRNDWCRFELKNAHRESQCNRKHKLIVVVLDKLSFKLMDPDAKMCFRNAPIIRWGDRRFWEKLRYYMPHGQGQNTIDPKMKFPNQRFPHSNSVKLV